MASRGEEEGRHVKPGSTSQGKAGALEAENTLGSGFWPTALGLRRGHRSFAHRQQEEKLAVEASLLRIETLSHFSQNRTPQGTRSSRSAASPSPLTPEPCSWRFWGRAFPVLPAGDKQRLKPYVDLLAEPMMYEDPALGALDFTQELDPAWLIVDTVIGEGEPCCFL